MIQLTDKTQKDI